MGEPQAQMQVHPPADREVNRNSYEYSIGFLDGNTALQRKEYAELQDKAERERYRDRLDRMVAAFGIGGTNEGALKWAIGRIAAIDAECEKQP